MVFVIILLEARIIIGIVERILSEFVILYHFSHLNHVNRIGLYFH